MADKAKKRLVKKKPIVKKTVPVKKPIVKPKQINYKRKLTPKQKKFCQEYVLEWNATRSYLKAYPKTKSEANAASMASRMLRNVKVQDYITEVQKDLEKLCGISKAKVINEHIKIAFSEDPGEDENPESEENKIKATLIKTADKIKSLEAISKLQGYEAPSKTEVTGKDGKPLIPSVKIEIINSASQVRKDDSGS